MLNTILYMMLNMINVNASDNLLEIKKLDSFLLNKQIKQTEKKQNLLKILPLVKKLQIKHIKDIKIDLPPLKSKFTTYLPCNSSIIKTNDGYELILRTVNWYNYDTYYLSLIRSEPKKTKNFYLKYDQKFNLLSQQEILNVSALAPDIIKNKELEDCRLFSWNDDLWFVSSVSISKMGPYLPKVAFCQLDKLESEKNKFIKSINLFYGPKPLRWEKNWLPFIVKNELLLIYSYDPFMIIKPDFSNNSFTTVIKSEPKLDFTRFRGSAAPIKFDEGYLMLIHETLYQQRRRFYLHRFLYLDENFNIAKISLPFTFTHVGVEFCCSMVLDYSQKDLIIPISIEDREAKICTVDMNYVKGLLFSLE